MKIKYMFVDECECGCRELAKPGKRFIAGHHNRGKHNPMYGKDRSKNNNPMYKKKRPDLSKRNKERAGGKQTKESNEKRSIKSLQYWDKVKRGFVKQEFNIWIRRN